MTWSVTEKQGCNTGLLSELISADVSDLYQPNSQLYVEYVRRGRYRVFNSTDLHHPFMYLEVAPEQSVLRPLFNDTTVKDDASLKVELSRDHKEWVLTLKAELNQCPETTDHQEEMKETRVTVFTPVVVIISAAIAILGILLVIGFITEPGRQVTKTDNRVQSRHLLFVVTLVTFRTAYSIAVTFTILLLLTRYINRDSMSQLAELPRYSSTAENTKQLQIGQIQSYVLQELQRQNELANETKTRCEEEMMKVQAALEESKQRLKVESSHDKLVSQMAMQYTKMMVVNLTENVNKFKQEFSTYAKKSLDKLTRSFVQTSSALQSNKWLAGAKVIYNAVKSKRSAQHKQTKSFLDWVGIRQDVDRLAVGENCCYM
ncbi:hypothetical protein NP493_713g01029 [Ridgeia piscesae]|uniref:Uncharacterized protein n=1 Tax=Ridgeia piscesae TaxID=27915 RepID=A0AAD9NQG4_RIDPI|nr:hypothetical protein NP493_713g01029 [Ridgeia piscesae]